MENCAYLRKNPGYAPGLMHYLLSARHCKRPYRSDANSLSSTYDPKPAHESSVDFGLLLLYKSQIICYNKQRIRTSCLNGV